MFTKAKAQASNFFASSSSSSSSNAGAGAPPTPNKNTYAYDHYAYREPQLPPTAASSSSRPKDDDEDIHMMTVNPRNVDPMMLAQLQHLSAEPQIQAQAQQAGSHFTQRHQQQTQQQQQQQSHYQPRSQIPQARDVVLKSRPAEPQVSGGGALSQQQQQTSAAGGRARTTDGGRVLSLWEREILANPEVKRKATLAQLYFLDYYFDLLGYLHARKGRLATFKADTSARRLSPEDQAREFRSYAGRERVLLRKRRTKLKVDQFRILAQVGQGGYGSVYLARKADTGQVCALKKMKKTTLAKMDEVKHVLIERDILTATKTPWLVKLLYAFQDRDHVYLAMVSIENPREEIWEFVVDVAHLLSGIRSRR